MYKRLTETYQHNIETYPFHNTKIEYYKVQNDIEDYITSRNNLVTIGIKTFMRPNALKKTLREILNTHTDIQILVADDSNDKYKQYNADIINELNSKYNNIINHIMLPFDTGVSEGRNIIVNNTITKYIVIIDDSRYITKKTKIHDMVNFLEDNNDYH